MDILNSIFPAAVIYTIPLLLGALGALYSERSGVTNLCIEGFMLMGCFSCAVTMVNLQGKIPMTFCFIIGMLVAVAVTAVYSLLHAVAAINLRADQVISGTALNMMSTALTVYLAQTVTNRTFNRTVCSCEDIQRIILCPSVDIHFRFCRLPHCKAVFLLCKKEGSV